ncbi:MAG: HPr family phosphocarrier protein [Gammaproteobacteria bacterium]|nr:HPr family phosphocarrier protein [Candidatus Thioaporhodococcus sediminis]TNF56049.1 MAG: HPr family phosphocarrier protein [Gammaproteobacteria bacterium]
MIVKEVEIVNRLGLHARASAKFVTCAGSFKSLVQVERDGRKVNGKSIMGVMMLAAAQGVRITLHIEGEDEAAACAALEALIHDRFGEGE